MQLVIPVTMAKIVLALVFAMAGIAKLADRDISRRMLVAFGVPAMLTPGLAAALPLAELAVAAALLYPPSAWVAGMAAVVLLLGFTAVIAINLARDTGQLATASARSRPRPSASRPLPAMPASPRSRS